MMMLMMMMMMMLVMLMMVMTSMCKAKAFDWETAAETLFFVAASMGPEAQTALLNCSQNPDSPSSPLQCWLLCFASEPVENVVHHLRIVIT